VEYNRASWLLLVLTDELVLTDHGYPNRARYRRCTLLSQVKQEIKLKPLFISCFYKENLLFAFHLPGGRTLHVVGESLAPSPGREMAAASPGSAAPAS